MLHPYLETWTKLLQQASIYVHVEHQLHITSPSAHSNSVQGKGGEKPSTENGLWRAKIPEATQLQVDVLSNNLTVECQGTKCFKYSYLYDHVLTLCYSIATHWYIHSILLSSL